MGCKNEPSPPLDLTLDHAQWMIKASISKAEEVSIPVTICIRDRHDNLVAHIRMKNAFLGSVDLACQKARTSALFPAPSSAIAENGALQLSNGIISGVQGALPLVTSQGAHLGSVGVSGAFSGEMDEEIAKVALAEKYDLELVAGSFFFTTYTEATNNLLCYFTKCTGAPFPLPAPGINDGADCQ